MRRGAPCSDTAVTALAISFGFFWLAILLGCGLGHELWKINETVKRIADTLTEMSGERQEKREEDAL